MPQSAPRMPSVVSPEPSPTELDRLDHQRTATNTATPGWRRWYSAGSANAFHHYRPEHTDHEVWIRKLERPALILGSSQPATVLSPRASDAEIEICRRRSGGGLVLLDPDHDLWIDVLVPSHSPLWQDDVTRAFTWLGDVWQRTLAELFTTEAVEVHGRSAGPAGRLLCYASVGHGEVTVGGRKVVGLSQRRTRSWARLQCSVIQHWRPTVLSELMSDDPANPDPFQVSAGLPEHVTALEPARLGEAFLTELDAEGRTIELSSRHSRP